MKRKITAILMAIALCAALLAGCGGSGDVTTWTDPASTPPSYDDGDERSEPSDGGSRISEAVADELIADVKRMLSADDYSGAYGYADSDTFKSFVENSPGSEYISGDGFCASVVSGEMVITLFNVADIPANGVFDGVEYFMWSMPVEYNGASATALKCGKSDVKENMYTGAYEEYWYIAGTWELVSSYKGNMVNGGFEGGVSYYGANSGNVTENYSGGYDGVYMNPEDRMPFAEGEEGIDAEKLYLLTLPEPTPPAEQETPSYDAEISSPPVEAEYTGDFVIEGKWKSVGEYGFGQAQPGAIVVFDGVNCNFYSPRDTYAFYENDGKYQLDVTSFMFAENLSFTIKIVDEDQIEIYGGSDTTFLKRVG
ncbi:MAG: hypothetical protein LBS51_01795 [Oscillospiraceae bacterium]|jgi:hypothetical protein|nr:hypothetical protein [Oscillospiraceae bacterium]